MTAGGQSDRRRRFRAHRVGRRWRILWTHRARNDLAEIGDYIAASNAQAADRWMTKLVRAVEDAALVPFAGRRVPEIGRDDVREVIRGAYRVVYEVQDDAIIVLTIFEGHRPLPSSRPRDEHG